MKKVMSSPLFWTGVISAALAIGGFAWYYQQYRAFHARFDPLMSAGAIVEANFPVLPRVLAIIGCLMGLMLTVACVIRAVERNRKHQASTGHAP